MPNLMQGLFIASLLLSFSACKKDKTVTNQQPPVIHAVTDLNNRTVELTAVNFGEWIIIKGQFLATTYKVDFNSVLAADSLIYADDTTVTVKIPAVLPDPENNPITVYTKYGMVTYNFRILQPPPTIVSFDPMAGATGEVVTIRGFNFGGVNSVKFGATNATIISSTKEEVKVNVPAGVTAAYIYVTTPSGTVRSDYRFGFRYEVFTDGITAGWTYSPSSANVVWNASNTSPVKRGINSLEITFRGAWSFLRLNKTPVVNITGYEGIKFSMYAPTEYLDKKVRVYLNNSSGAGAYTITVTKVNEWIQYEIPLINFGNPTSLSQIAFNEFSGSAVFPRSIYVDDLGLY